MHTRAISIHFRCGTDYSSLWQHPHKQLREMTWMIFECCVRCASPKSWDKRWKCNRLTLNYVILSKVTLKLISFITIVCGNSSACLKSKRFFICHQRTVFGRTVVWIMWLASHHIKKHSLSWWVSVWSMCVYCNNLQCQLKLQFGHVELLMLKQWHVLFQVWICKWVCWLVFVWRLHVLQ